MVNNKVIDLFEEDITKYDGYYYVKLNNPLNEEYQNYFKKGIKRLKSSYDYYLKERVSIHGNPSINRLDEALDVANDNYNFINVEAGVSPISILDYSYNTLFCNKILEHFSKEKYSSSFSKTNLFEVFDGIGDISLKITKLEDRYMSDNYIPLKDELEETVNAKLIVYTAGKIFETFERTQSAQIRDEKTWKIIKWNIRSEAEIDIEDEYGATCLSGLRFLRKVEFQKDNPPSFKIQKSIDDFTLDCLKDEFRYQYADYIGILEPELARQSVLNKFESSNFEAQYKTLSDKRKSEFDVDSRIFLKDLAESREMKYNLGLNLNLGL